MRRRQRMNRGLSLMLIVARLNFVIMWNTQFENHKVMLLIVLVPAILVFQAIALPCEESHIRNQLTGSSSRLCQMVYSYKQETKECQFTHCLSPCSSESILFSFDEKQCLSQCPKVSCEERLLHGSEQNQNEGNDGGGSDGGSKLKTILAIVLSIVGAFILLLICCCVYKRCNRAVNNTGSAQDQTFTAIDEKNIEMMGSHQTEIMKNCSSSHPTDNRNNCAIDLLNKANVKLSCEHFFHPKCILDWKAKKDCCPLCRKEIKNDFIVYCCVCFVSNLKIKALLNKKYVCQGCSNQPIEEPDAISQAQ